jgi:hypothetical protein
MKVNTNVRTLFLKDIVLLQVAGCYTSTGSRSVVTDICEMIRERPIVVVAGERCGDLPSYGICHVHNANRPSRFCRAAIVGAR